MFRLSILVEQVLQVLSSDRVVDTTNVDTGSHLSLVASKVEGGLFWMCSGGVLDDVDLSKGV